MYKLIDIKTMLDKDYGDMWPDLETETLIHDLESKGLAYTTGLTDLVEILKCIEVKPDLLFDDVLFFLHSVDAINGNAVHFDFIPVPTSLELAWAVYQIELVLGDVKKILPLSGPIKTAVTYILKGEGFTSSTAFFKDYVLPNEFPAESAEPDKEKAIELYIKGMNNGMGS